MQIPIPIPRWLIRAKGIFGDWANVPVIELPGLLIEVRRIDVLLAFGFIACVGWYAMMGGWQGALLGGLTYVFVALIALWF
jgi:hypothetical protein